MSRNKSPQESVSSLGARADPRPVSRCTGLTVCGDAEVSKPSTVTDGALESPRKKDWQTPRQARGLKSRSMSVASSFGRSSLVDSTKSSRSDGEVAPPSSHSREGVSPKSRSTPRSVFASAAGNLIHPAHFIPCSKCVRSRFLSSAVGLSLDHLWHLLSRDLHMGLKRPLQARHCTSLSNAARPSVASSNSSAASAEKKDTGLPPVLTNTKDRRQRPEHLGLLHLFSYSQKSKGGARVHPARGL
ncbi:uncharacterized protein LOC134557984 [Prinia subflava]|uniref:uncharacterized protein LOC134557983 n=1 Tax=Prinia subflava TaxID=208062 RepID=UPI002FE32856